MGGDDTHNALPAQPPPPQHAASLGSAPTPYAPDDPYAAGASQPYNPPPAYSGGGYPQTQPADPYSGPQPYSQYPPHHGYAPQYHGGSADHQVPYDGVQASATLSPATRAYPSRIPTRIPTRIPLPPSPTVAPPEAPQAYPQAHQSSHHHRQSHAHGHRGHAPSYSHAAPTQYQSYGSVSWPHPAQQYQGGEAALDTCGYAHHQYQYHEEVTMYQEDVSPSAATPSLPVRPPSMKAGVGKGSKRSTLGGRRGDRLPQPDTYPYMRKRSLSDAASVDSKQTGQETSFTQKDNPKVTHEASDLYGMQFNLKPIQHVHEPPRVVMVMQNMPCVVYNVHRPSVHLALMSSESDQQLPAVMTLLARQPTAARVAKPKPDPRGEGNRPGASSKVLMRNPQLFLRPVQDRMSDEQARLIAKLQPGDVVLCDSNLMTSGRLRPTVDSVVLPGENDRIVTDEVRDELRDLFEREGQRTGRKRLSEDLAMRPIEGMSPDDVKVMTARLNVMEDPFNCETKVLQRKAIGALFLDIAHAVETWRDNTPTPDELPKAFLEFLFNRLLKLPTIWGLPQLTDRDSASMQVDHKLFRNIGCLREAVEPLMRPRDIAHLHAQYGWLHYGRSGIKLWVRSGEDPAAAMRLVQKELRELTPADEMN
eukprot:TRINITY_DN2954_c3_g1_i1.p1 TRINITY_DN2954_c3_g1~~TRINITY_DN2954_c3_g1_i1.p1  ORF type:complete len:647 (+),score=128.24 TRINITY_DN2954_c3_g1_i1:55-1995(+)